MGTEHEESPKREAIMEAAIRLFSERGYNGVSVREITEGAGITKPTLYYHFGSKQGLCGAILRAVSSDVRRIEEECLRSSSDPVEQIRAIARAKFRATRENPRVVKFLTEFLLGPDAANILEDMDVEKMWRESGLYRAVEAGQKAGVLRRDVSADLITTALQGALDRYIIASVHYGIPELTDELAESIVSVILTGIAAEK